MSSCHATAHSSPELRAFVSEVFHSLAQPLTALHCSLELALLQDRSAKEYRASIQAALENAERLRRGLTLARELAEASDPGETASVPLLALLEEARQELLPVLSVGSRNLDVRCTGTISVRGNHTNLLRGFVYLLEFCLRRYSGDLKVVAAQQPQSQVTINIEPLSLTASDIKAECETSSQLQLAGRIFSAAGGCLSWRPACQPTQFRVELPLSPASTSSK